MPSKSHEHIDELSPEQNMRRRPAIAMPARYRNRPASIRRAIYLVWKNNEQLALTISGVSVLQALIATGLDIDSPYKAIFAKKKTLAIQSGVSEASVYRTLNHLEQRCFITRSAQQHCKDGSLSLTKITITESLAKFLGISSQTKETHPEQIVIVPANSTEKLPPQQSADPIISPILQDGLRDGMQDAAYIREQKVDQMIDQKAKPSVKDQSTGADFLRIGHNYNVPAGLVWLIAENRLSCPQLFKLMKLAKGLPGQQLEDYVNLRKSRLLQLKTINDCYRYLSKLISNGIDARFLLAQQNKAKHREERVIQKRRADETRYIWLRDRDGQTFVDQATGRSYTVQATNGLVVVGVNGVPTRTLLKVNGRFIERVKKGELVRLNPLESKDRVQDAPQERIDQLFYIQGRMKTIHEIRCS